MTKGDASKLILSSIYRGYRNAGPTVKELKRMKELNKAAIAKFTNHPYAMKLVK
jgi:hypothetical protein